jgi:hypothetical protein
MKSIFSNTLILVGTLVFTALGQTKDAYQQDNKTGSGLLDPSRFTVHHSLSMGMSSSTMSSLQSQSLYSTMLQYQFAQPVTLNLNFGLPIYNTANQFQNLTTSNIKSADYFKNMPFDATLSWKPRDNMLLQFSVIRRTVNDYLSNDYYSPLGPQHNYRGNFGW